MQRITEVSREVTGDKKIEVRFLVSGTPVKIIYQRGWTGKLEEMFYATGADHVNKYETDFPVEKMAEKMADQLKEATDIEDVNETVKDGINSVISEE